MGFRIRKSIKIAPGLRINLSKSGVSASVGKRGATVNIGKNGVKSTIGIPGTGISHTVNHSKNNRRHTVQTEPQNGHVSGWVTLLSIGFVLWLVFKIF